MDPLTKPRQNSSTAPRTADSRWIALAGSLVLHLILFGLLGLAEWHPPELPIRLPLELEIGLGDSDDEELGGAAKVEGKRSETPPAQTPLPAPKPTLPKPAAAKPVVVDEQSIAAATTSTTDAALTTADAGQAPPEGSGTADTGAVGPRRGTGGGAGSGFGTDGALLALRVDVANVRASALILETESLLSLVPGWQRMFAGSGLSPLSHFKRFVIASPNLHPSRLSMAAALREGLRGVEALQKRASREAPLREEHGVTLGGWSSRGTTARDIAFLNDQTFVIARAQDVARLLMLGRVLGSRIVDGDRDPDPVVAGLLHMGKTEALSLTVHHVAAFVPEAARGGSVGPAAELPNDLHFLLDEPTQHAVQLHVIGEYDSVALADGALSRWRKVYDDFAARPDVAMLGLAGAIEHATFERRDIQLHARTQLTMAQLRYLLGQLREILQALVPQSAE